MTHVPVGVWMWIGIFAAAWIGFVARLVHGPFGEDKRTDQEKWDELTPEQKKDVKWPWPDF